MQTPLVILSSVLTAVVASYLFVTLQPPADAAALPEAVREDDLEASIAALRDGQAELARAVERLDAAREVAPTRQAIPGISDEQVTRVLEAMFEARGVELSSLVDAAAVEGAGPLSVDTALAQIAAGMGYDEKEELWKQLREAGLIDDMVAAFKARADQYPDVADAQAQLGDAYLQKLFGVPDNEKGKWSMLADRSYDEALDIDPKHWDARFAKAISLSHWPSFMGRGPEAMKHFETLIEQQESSGGGHAGYANSYLFLGNMYHQAGKREEAKEVWQRGYNLHPGSAALAARLKN